MPHSLPMAMVAEMGNLLLSFMSAWMVGNVEAPANANIIEPKAEKKEIIYYGFAEENNLVPPHL